MASSFVSNYRIEPLRKDNYDTWVVQAQAILIKNGLWSNVTGEKEKPAESSAADIKAKWMQEDLSARSDLFLIISPSELKQVRNCATSKDVWATLKTIYQSDGPARKATLLKRLVLHKMKDTDDVREHLNTFMDAVDKLNDMSIEINPDLLSIMMLYSLSPTFENFRVAIETRDTLPKPQDLKVKILEEAEARKNDISSQEDAFYGTKFKNQTGKTHFKNKNKQNIKTNNSQKPRCMFCNKDGHTIDNCWFKNKNKNCANKKNEKTFVTEECHSILPGSPKPPTWFCLDSGSTSHMCSDQNKFSDMSKVDNGFLQLASTQHTTSIDGKGLVKIDFDKNNTVNLPNTLFVPNLSANLLSVGKITDSGYNVTFTKDKADIIDAEGNTIFQATRTNGLYYLKIPDKNTDSEKCLSHVNSNSSFKIEEWHRKLGHINEHDLKTALKNQKMIGLQFNPSESLNDCEICIRGKMSSLPFKTNPEQKSLELLQIVHSDVVGPMRTESHGGCRYFVTFIDEYSRYTKIYFLKQKNEVLNHFKEFKCEVEKFTGKHIKFLQSDNGVAEYKSKEFSKYLVHHGIQRRLSAPYTPQQNGLAERKNRSVLDKTRCLLLESHLPDSFWAEAVFCANYLINRSPSRSLNGKTPFELWFGHPPSVKHLKIFGSKSFFLNKNQNKSKFDSRAIEGIFVGYSEQSKAFRIWDPIKKKIIVTRDVRTINKMFYETSTTSVPKLLDGHKNPNSNPTSEDMVDFNIIVENPEENTENPETQSSTSKSTEDDESYDTEDDDQSPPKNEIGLSEAPQSSTNIRLRDRNNLQPPNWTLDYVMTASSEHDMLQGPDANAWQNAVKDELRAHLKNDTWKIVPLKKDSNVIGSKMILKCKYKPSGELERRKARLVARGFAQRPGLDFTETYAPVTKLSSIRLLLALSVEEDLHINQLDVSTAFLNGEISEEIFMEKPANLERFLTEIMLDESDAEDSTIFLRSKQMLQDLKQTDGKTVCHLNKALYGLKQAGRNWFQKLDSKLKHLGFQASPADPCVYVSFQGGDKILLAIYVDDIILASNNMAKLNVVKKLLMNIFEMRDLGDLQHCLGIEFSRKEGKIYASQSRYIDEVLDKFNMSTCKPVRTPLAPGTQLIKNPSDTLPDYPYQNLIGTLMYLSMGTRPDISHSVSYLSQYNMCFDKSHWLAAKRVLRYLKGTRDLALVYQKTGKPLHGHADANWGSCAEDRRSYTGYLFKFAGAAISWESRKQRTVALSTQEAEYMALTDAAKEAMHLKQLISDMGIKHEAIELFNDNLAAQDLTRNPIVSARSKHISIREHFIREKVQDGDIVVSYKPTEIMEADILTKGLAGPRHDTLQKAMGLQLQLKPTE